MMKFYEKSLSDQIARIKGGKLRVSDILRWLLDSVLCFFGYLDSSSGSNFVFLIGLNTK